MTMVRFDRFVRVLCAVLLMAVTVMGSFGPSARYSSAAEPVMTSIMDPVAELTGGHLTCQHSTEHSHDVMPSLNNDVTGFECLTPAHYVALDKLHLLSGLSPVDPPPRTELDYRGRMAVDEAPYVSLSSRYGS